MSEKILLNKQRSIDLFKKSESSNLGDISAKGDEDISLIDDHYEEPCEPGENTISISREIIDMKNEDASSSNIETERFNKLLKNQEVIIALLNSGSCKSAKSSIKDKIKENTVPQSNVQENPANVEKNAELRKCIITLQNAISMKAILSHR